MHGTERLIIMTCWQHSSNGCEYLSAASHSSITGLTCVLDWRCWGAGGMPSVCAWRHRIQRRRGLAESCQRVGGACQPASPSLLHCFPPPPPPPPPFGRPLASNHHHHRIPSHAKLHSSSFPSSSSLFSLSSLSSASPGAHRWQCTRMQPGMWTDSGETSAGLRHMDRISAREEKDGGGGGGALLLRPRDGRGTAAGGGGTCGGAADLEPAHNVSLPQPSLHRRNDLHSPLQQCPFGIRIRCMAWGTSGRRPESRSVHLHARTAPAPSLAASHSSHAPAHPTTPCNSRATVPAAHNRRNTTAGVHVGHPERLWRDRCRLGA